MNICLQNKAFAEFVNESFAEDAFRGTLTYSNGQLIDADISMQSYIRTTGMRLIMACFHVVIFFFFRSVPTMISQSLGYHHHGSLG